MLHVVLDGAGLIGRNGTQTRGSRAAAGVSREEAQGPDAAAATGLVFLQDPDHLQGGHR